MTIMPSKKQKLLLTASLYYPVLTVVGKARYRGGCITSSMERMNLTAICLTIIKRNSTI